MDIEKNPETLIIGLAYRNFGIIKTTLECIADCAAKADIFAIDNNSDRSEAEILPYLRSLCDRGVLVGVFAFDENIAANAYESVFDSGLISLEKYKYIVVTDLDLQIEGGWLEDHQFILDSCPEVFSLSVPLSLENIPANFKDKHPVPGRQHELYEEFHTGAHLTTFRAEEFLRFLLWRRMFNYFFADRYFEVFGAQVLGKLTARSKKRVARHLTWDLIGKDDQYFKDKVKAGNTLWRSDSYCAYTYFHSSSSCRYWPLLNPPPHRHITYYPLSILNDTGVPVSVTIDRCWPDGTRVGSRFFDIEPGNTSERGIHHYGKTVMIVLQNRHQGGALEARVEFELGAQRDAICFKLSDYLSA